VLGVNARQLNRPCGSGNAENQLRHWHQKKMFQPKLTESEIAQSTRLYALGDGTASVEERARSYLDANCAYCHQPDHHQQMFDARMETPLARQRLVEALAFRAGGGGATLLVRPGDRDRSLLYQRLTACDNTQMPPLGRSMADMEAAAVIGAWIDDIGYRRRLWCAKGSVLAIIVLSAGATLSIWLHGWFRRRQTLTVVARGIANLPLLVAVTASIAVPLAMRDQGSIRFVLAGIGVVLGITSILGAFLWLRRADRRPKECAAHGTTPVAESGPARQAA
jgi:hypothetical protein